MVDFIIGCICIFIALTINMVWENDKQINKIFNLLDSITERLDMYDEKTKTLH